MGKQPAVVVRTKGAVWIRAGEVVDGVHNVVTASFSLAAGKRLAMLNTWRHRSRCSSCCLLEHSITTGLPNLSQILLALPRKLLRHKLYNEQGCLTQ